MCSVTKHLVRAGVIGTILIGGAAVIAGPDRIGALFHQTRNAINDKIDANISDPVALRAQLRTLEAEYPRRIETVRGDLAELRQQKSVLTRDLAISNKVVTMAEKNREDLLAMIEQAQDAHVRTVADDGQPAQVVIVFNNERLDINGAQSAVDDAAATRAAHATRAVDLQKSLDLLDKQESRLVSILSKLETERTAFQGQMWTIDQEVDSIARNERMITIVSKWQDSIDEHSRYRAGSLDHVKSRLADVRARQEARLDTLAQQTKRTNYESAARAELDREAADSARTGAPRAAEKPVKRNVIEIRPQAGATTNPSNKKPADTFGPLSDSLVSR